MEVNHFSISFLQKYFFGSVNFGAAARDTKLSIAIAAPHIQLALVVESHCVLRSAFDFNDVGEAGNFVRDDFIIVVAEAKSAVLATAPSVNFTFVC